MKTTILVIVGVFILVAGIFAIKSLSVASIEDSVLIGTHTHLFIVDGCPHCENQLQMFGDNNKYLNITDCFLEIEKCRDVTEFPTWIIAEKRYEGVKSIKELKELIYENYLIDIYGNITSIPTTELGKSCPFNLSDFN